MITVKKLRELLATDSPMNIMLPSGEFVPEHFHVTEVGLVRKIFIDCGGTWRRTNSCVLQVWTAHDTDHRLSSGKLAKIFEAAKVVLLTEDVLLVEIEYGSEFVSQYPVTDVEVTPKGLLFVLGGKHTECLAPDKCGVSGCC